MFRDVFHQNEASLKVNLYIRPIASGIFHEISDRKKESNFYRHAFVWSVKLAKFSGARSRVQPRAMTRLARLNELGSGSPWRVLSTTAKFPRTGFNNTISFGKVARQRGRAADLACERCEN